MSRNDATSSVASRCHASWDGEVLILGNALFRETWVSCADGRLQLSSFRPTDREDFSARAEALPPAAWRASLTTRVVRLHASEHPSFVAELRFSDPANADVWRVYRFQIFPEVPGALLLVLASEHGASADDASASDVTPQADGIETADNGMLKIPTPPGALPAFGLGRPQMRVREVRFTDQTDHHATFASMREWLLHPSERALPLQTNLVHVEDVASAEGEGFLLLLMAPLHHVRAAWSAPFDFLFSHIGTGRFAVTACPGGYTLARLAYSGGANGAALVLQALQRALHEWNPDRDGLVLSNTWGDRSGASRLNEAFMLSEIAAARTLGVEVVQIDDGWQKGDTVNTVTDRARGVWNGFWAADPEFWSVHPSRFPRGLAPLVAAARGAGLRLGLWFAPDSTGDFANWEKDAAQLLLLWREHGVAHFKLDAVKIRSRVGEQRLHALCDRVQGESEGRVLFDFDATAERRPTYWGRLHGGPLFLENRYTDRGSYYPHQTLNALWTLASAGVFAPRIRLEFLNPSRNGDVYPSGSPLRPAAYPAATLLAITLPASPLAWCELSRLSDAVSAEWAALLSAWKPHRDDFQAGHVLPIGRAPDGYAWTGFVSWNAETSRLYALVFRELSATGEAEFSVPSVLGISEQGTWSVPEIIAGAGEARLADGGRLRVRIPEVQGFLLVRWGREKI